MLANRLPLRRLLLPRSRRRRWDSGRVERGRRGVLVVTCRSTCRSESVKICHFALFIRQSSGVEEILLRFNVLLHEIYVG